MKFLDTTLRDGEQIPGVSLTPEKKLQIARGIDQLGVEAYLRGMNVLLMNEDPEVR